MTSFVKEQTLSLIQCFSMPTIPFLTIRQNQIAVSKDGGEERRGHLSCSDVAQFEMICVNMSDCQNGITDALAGCYY